jgi:hypothetical protein
MNIGLREKKFEIEFPRILVYVRVFVFIHRQP